MKPTVDTHLYDLYVFQGTQKISALLPKIMLFNAVSPYGVEAFKLKKMQMYHKKLYIKAVLMNALLYVGMQ